MDLSSTLACKNIPAGSDPGMMSKVTSSDGTHRDVSDVHPVHLLPKEFVGLTNGHNGSHQFLVHDFVTSCVRGEIPPNNVWQAARYLVPGLVAHELALKGGELMKVPDFGDAPPESLPNRRYLEINEANDYSARHRHSSRIRCSGGRRRSL